MNPTNDPMAPSPSRSHPPTRSPSPHRRILLLELHHPDGEVGWSECVAGEQPNYGPETIDTAWHAIREWIACGACGEPDDPRCADCTAAARATCGVVLGPDGPECAPH